VASFTTPAVGVEGGCCACCGTGVARTGIGRCTSGGDGEIDCGPRRGDGERGGESLGVGVVAVGTERARARGGVVVGLGDEGSDRLAGVAGCSAPTALGGAGVLLRCPGALGTASLDGIGDADLGPVFCRQDEHEENAQLNTTQHNTTQQHNRKQNSTADVLND